MPIKPAKWYSPEERRRRAEEDEVNKVREEADIMKKEGASQGAIDNYILQERAKNKARTQR